MVFIASTPDGGNVQIAGRADVWATGRARGDQASPLPGVYASPTEAADALARQTELLAYTHAGSYCLWRERLARRRLARTRAAPGRLKALGRAASSYKVTLGYGSGDVPGGR